MVHPGTTLPKDVSWKIEGDYKVYMFYWFTCSGDQIVIPELTIHYDTHGVNNGKMSLFQGKINYTGLGFSELTFEYYYLNEEIQINDKAPILNGAATFTSKRTVKMTGHQGSVDNGIIKLHTTVNANGELVSSHLSEAYECE